MWRLNMWNFSQISNSVSRNRKNSYLLNGVILEQPIKKWVNQQEQKKMMMKTERDGVFLKKKDTREKMWKNSLSIDENNIYEKSL